jgi:hypothetical protein
MLTRQIIFGLALLLCSSLIAGADTGRIYKVLPHYLDRDGRHVVAPSLFERDAYQAYLRENPESRAGLRFDVNWGAKRAGASIMVLRLELRGSEAASGEVVILERKVKPPRLFRNWSSLRLDGEDYRRLGALLAWRATLWRGDEMLAEQKSFLW